MFMLLWSYYSIILMVGQFYKINFRTVALSLITWIPGHQREIFQSTPLKSDTAGVDVSVQRHLALETYNHRMVFPDQVPKH